MGVFYGLAAALGYGVADFAATKAARQVGVLRTLLAVQVFGLVGIGLVVALRGEAPTGSAGAWSAMLVAAVVDFGGMLLLYRAFAVGTLSLVSPIASGFAVITAGLALAVGERPPGLALAGAVLLVAGVAVVSRSGADAATTLAGIPDALGAALGLGAYFWALGELTPTLGVYWPVLATRAIHLALVLALMRFRGERGLTPGRALLPVLAAAGLLDTAALVAFNLGVDAAFTTTTTALTSLYSAVTVLLAWLFLRERLRGSQWAGIGVVLAGVFLVSV